MKTEVPREGKRTLGVTTKTQGSGTTPSRSETSDTVPPLRVGNVSLKVVDSIGLVPRVMVNECKR